MDNNMDENSEIPSPRSTNPCIPIFIPEGYVPAPIKKRKWHLFDWMIERSKKLHENNCDVEKAD
jgi:hypothetical protein